MVLVELLFILEIVLIWNNNFSSKELIIELVIIS